MKVPARDAVGEARQQTAEEDEGDDAVHEGRVENAAGLRIAQNAVLGDQADQHQHQEQQADRKGPPQAAFFRRGQCCSSSPSAAASPS